VANEEDFKVFISWSGPLAKGVAGALRDWLPTMFDRIEPWFSDTDIPAGATWFGEVQDRLNSSDFGIVIITTENLNKPWLNFEAGSLSKKLKDEIGRVTPILVNFNEVTQLTGHPLEQYNAVLLDKDGIR
jgi:TIR domain